jgi:t-SNARE complex subunit (syntaxin)
MDERTPLLTSPRASARGRSQLDDLQERTMQFNSDIAELSRLRDALGTKKDTHSFRNQLRIKREECANNAKSLSAQLKRINPTTKEDKIRLEKIKKQLQEIVDRLQQISRQSIEKEKLHPVYDSAQQQEEDNNPFNDPDVRSHQGEKIQSTAVVQDFSVEQAIIDERKEDMVFLENEMRNLNEVFIDIAKLIHDQGQDLDTIEANTSTAVVETDKGVDELKKASEYQKSSRKKLCCLTLLLVIIVAAIAIVCWLFLARGKI